MVCTLVARAGLEVICLAIYSVVLEAINNLSHLPSEGVKSLQAINDLSYLRSFTDNFRGERWDHERLCWDDHVTQLQHEGIFSAEYHRMSLKAWLTRDKDD